MTTTEIWNLLNQINPKKPVYGLACSMASLDTQTVLDLIEKYRQDQKMSEKQIRQELQKQKFNKILKGVRI